MIRVEGLGATYGEVWYEEEPSTDAGVDIIRYSQRPAPLERGRSVPFLSLVTDLDVADAAIAARFNKECRYEIRRADAKDDLHFDFIAEPAARLDEFCAFHESFASQRSLGPYDQRWLVAAARARQLVLTVAVRNGEALVWHAYVVAGKAAGLEYSSSLFRGTDSAHRALVGRANRWLHWRDMLRFKELGYERYDWGGLFEDESVPAHAGINAFKKGFGGRRERSYDCEVPVTMRGRIWAPVRDAWREWTRLRAGWSRATWPKHSASVSTHLRKA